MLLRCRWQNRTWALLFFFMTTISCELNAGQQAEFTVVSDEVPLIPLVVAATSDAEFVVAICGGELMGFVHVWRRQPSGSYAKLQTDDIFGAYTLCILGEQPKMAIARVHPARETQAIVEIWDLIELKKEKEFECAGKVFRMDSTRNGELLAVGGPLRKKEPNGRIERTAEIHVFDIVRNNEVARISKSAGGVTSICLADDGRRLAVIAMGLARDNFKATVHVIDLAEPDAESQKIDVQNPRAIGFTSPENELVVVQEFDAKLRFKNVSRNVAKEIDAFQYPRALTISQDFKFIAFSNSDRPQNGLVKLFSVMDGNEVAHRESARQTICAMAIGDDGRFVVIGEDKFADSRIVLWNLPSND